jgi:eukaryotic-like serine/threonine-protein kinase
MAPERWARIDQLLDEAMDLPVAERAAFLNETCADDVELRREIESLLAAHQQAETNFLQKPALDVAAQQLAARSNQPLMKSIWRAIRD